MIRVFYSHITHQRKDSEFEFYLNKVPAELKNKIVRYRRWQDAHASLFGKLLLQFGLNSSGFGSFKLTDIKYSSYYRPYFEGNIDFNISHSGAFVVCAISNECKVGVDIEEIKPIVVEDLRQQWTNKEWEQIVNAENQYNQFYNYWTKKEALLKALGEGLSVPLQQIEVSGKFGLLREERWYFKKLPIAKHYITHLASDKEIAKTITIEKIDFPENIG